MSDVLEECLRAIGIEYLHRTPEGYEGKCPFCDSSRRSFRAAQVGKDGRPGSFFCHKCGVFGGLVELLMRGFRLSRAQAEEQAGDFSGSLRRSAKKLRRRGKVVFGTEHISPFRRNLSLWLVNERGYEEEWVWHYRVGLDLVSNEVVYPTYDVSGDLVGITRRVAEDGQIAVHAEGFEKRDHLWGIDLAINSGQKSVFVVEGQTDTLGLAPIAAPVPVVCSFGSYMSNVQADILAAHFEEVILCYDVDEAGVKGTRAARRVLARRGVHRPKCALISEEGFDCGDLPKLEDPQIDVMSFREWKKVMKERGLYHA